MEPPSWDFRAKQIKTFVILRQPQQQQNTSGIVYIDLPCKLWGLRPFLGPLNQPTVRKYDTLGNWMMVSSLGTNSTNSKVTGLPSGQNQLLGKKREYRVRTKKSGAGTRGV